MNINTKDKDLINKGFAMVGRDLADIKKDIVDLKEDVGGLKEDVGGLKEDVGGIKKDIENLAQAAQAEFAVVNVKLDSLSKVAVTHAYDIERLKMKVGLD